MNKKLVHAVAYDIFNWSFNISTIAFMWSLSHYFAVLLTGLFAMKWVANRLYLKSLHKEQEDYRQQVMKQMNAFNDKLRNAEQGKLEKHADILQFDSNKNKDTLQ